MRIQHCVRFLCAAWVVLLTSTVLAQVQFGGSEFYQPDLEARTFTDAGQGVLSPDDPRLALASGNCTIEFWVRPQWDANSSVSEMKIYNVLADRRIGLVPADAAAATPPAATGPAEMVKAYRPRYAIYMDEANVYVHIGATLFQKELTKEAKAAIDDAKQWIYFVVTADATSIKIYANGSLAAGFDGVKLLAHSPKGDLAGQMGTPVGEATSARLLLGGLPDGAPLGVVKRKIIGASRQPDDPSIDLDKVLQPFKGMIGGLRVWSRTLGTDQFLQSDSPMTQRGPDDVRRNVAFPPARNGGQAKYKDLIVYSDFFAADPDQHRLRLQYPVSGVWLNDTLNEMRVSKVSAPGLPESWGNADDYPVFTVLPSADPATFFVYQDSLLMGMFVHRDGEPATKWSFTPDLQGRDYRVGVTVNDNDTLSIQFEQPADLFGGNARRPVQEVRLKRPTLEWKGGRVDADTGFFNNSFIANSKVMFRSFDILTMDRLNAYTGETGSAKHVFAEPDRLAYTLDRNAGGAVVPFGFRYTKIDQGRAFSQATVCTSEQEVDVLTSAHGGYSFEFGGATGTSHLATSLFQDTDQKRDVNSVSISHAVNRNFMVCVDKVQSRLSADFIYDIGVLRRAYDEGPERLKSECRLFRERWGTHYPIGTTFGGMLIFARKFTEAEVIDIHKTGMKIEDEVKVGLKSQTTVSGGFNAGVVQGGMSFQMDTSLETAFPTGSDTSREVKKKNLNSTANSDVFKIPAGKTLTAGTGESETYSYEDPVPLFYDLRPLDELLSPIYFDDPVILFEVRDALRSELREYVLSVRPNEKNLEPLRFNDPKPIESITIKLKDLTVPVDFDGYVRVNLFTSVKGDQPIHKNFLHPYAGPDPAFPADTGDNGLVVVVKKERDIDYTIPDPRPEKAPDSMKPPLRTITFPDKSFTFEFVPEGNSWQRYPEKAKRMELPDTLGVTVMALGNAAGRKLFKPTDDPNLAANSPMYMSMGQILFPREKGFATPAIAQPMQMELKQGMGYWFGLLQRIYGPGVEIPPKDQAAQAKMMGELVWLGGLAQEIKVNVEIVHNDPALVPQLKESSDRLKLYQAFVEQQAQKKRQAYEASQAKARAASQLFAQPVPAVAAVSAGSATPMPAPALVVSEPGVRRPRPGLGGVTPTTSRVRGRGQRDMTREFPGTATVADDGTVTISWTPRSDPANPIQRLSARRSPGLRPTAATTSADAPTTQPRSREEISKLMKGFDLEPDASSFTDQPGPGEFIYVVTMRTQDGNSSPACAVRVTVPGPQ